MNRIDAIYARQSVDRMDSISIESQINFCEYETRGEPYKVFEDKGYSGKNTDRPRLQEMMGAIHRGEVKRVICYKLDRISRSILDFANMMEDFRRHDVEFVSCTEKFDTGTPMGRAMLSICIVFAQLERETIQQRVTDAYNARSRRGFFMGGHTPYGFDLEPYMLDGKHTSRYVINQDEAKVLQLIYSLYAQPQVSVGDIVKYLVEHDIRNSRASNGSWDKSRIADMIKNPIYVRADMNIYRFFHDQNSQLHNPPEDYIGTNGCYLYSDKNARRKTVSLASQHVVLAPHEGIIPSDIWLRARAKCMGNQQVAKPLKAKNTWLAGKIKCGKCGYALLIRKSPTKVGRYFVCSRRVQTVDGCVGVGGLHASEIEEIVLSQMQARLSQFQTLSEPAGPHLEPKTTELQVKLTHIEEEIEGLLDKLLHAQGVLTDYINRRINELDKQKTQLQREIAELESASVRKDSDIRQITDYMNRWELLSIQDKMAVVDILIVKIIATENTLDIIWKI